MHSSGVTGNGIIVPKAECTHTHKPTPTSQITQHALPFPVSVPIWWVGWPHHESLLSSVHPGNAKGSGSDGWVTSTSHPFQNPPPHHHFNNDIFDPAASHPASSCSTMCTCYYSLCLSDVSFTLMPASSCVGIHSRSIARNASLDVHSPQMASARCPTSWPSSHDNLIFTRGKTLRLWDTENISPLFTPMHLLLPLWLCLCNSDNQHTETS